MDTGGVTMEAVHLKMVKRLLSGDTVRIVANVKTLGAVADLEPETVNLTLNLNRNENFILTENPAIEPNVC